jgi:hypothetical protein
MTKTAKIITSAALILVLAVGIALACVTQSFQDWTPAKNNTADTAPVAVGDDTVEMEIGQTYAMPAKLSFSAPAMAAAATEGHTASVNLTATVTPVEATNKKVDWTVAWGTAPTHGSETVTDYVDVTPSSDGSTTATVTCHKAFADDKILITVRTREGGFTATCTVSYVGTPTTLGIETTGATVVTDSGWNVKIAEVACGTTYNFNLAPNNEFGSVGSAFVPNYTVSFTTSGTFVMNNGAIGNPTMNGTETVSLDGWVNNTITYQYDTYVKHNRYISFSIVDNKLQIVPENVVSGLTDLSDVSGRGWTGKRFGSYTDANKIPYVTITVTETKTGLSQSVNVRCISSVKSVSLSSSAVSF